MAHTHDPLDLFCGTGQQHSQRNDAKIRQPIALVGLQFFLRCNQAAVAGDGAKLLEDVGVQNYSAARRFARSGYPEQQVNTSVHKRQTVLQ